MQCQQSSNTHPGHSVSRGASQAKTHFTPRLRCGATSCCITAQQAEKPGPEEDRKHHRHQRRRRALTTACSETVEDACSTSSEVRIKSKGRMRRQRRAQKYTTTTHRDVSSCAVITWFFHLHLSAPLHSHVIVTRNSQLKCETSPAQTWTADFSRPSCAERREGADPGGYEGVRLCEAQNPAKADHERPRARRILPAADSHQRGG